MDIRITDKAKEKLLLMQERNNPIILAKIPVGWSGFIYKIVSAKQSVQYNVYTVDGIEIMVAKDLEKTLKGAEIDYGGFLFKNFVITPLY